MRDGTMRARAPTALSTESVAFEKSTAATFVCMGEVSEVFARHSNPMATGWLGRSWPTLITACACPGARQACGAAPRGSRVREARIGGLASELPPSIGGPYPGRGNGLGTKPEGGRDRLKSLG